MARFLHLANGRYAEHIRRTGLRPSPFRAGERAVFCVPVVPDFAKTFQWARELRHHPHSRTLVAVFFEVADQERVLIGRFGTRHAEMTAAEAHAAYRDAQGPAGQEVLIRRRIEAREIRKLAPAPRLAGWRHYPEAKGDPQSYWPMPGMVNAARKRAVIQLRESQTGFGALPHDPLIP